MVLRLLISAVLVSGAAAACANNCGGNGVCGRNDVCTCHANFYGIDCSKQYCPYGKAWADASGHDYAECSNQGSCDSSSGECQCFDGFEGADCGRTACSEDGDGCSGHGTCEFVDEITTTYQSWDKGKTRRCVCDAGYSGATCASRLCPKGDDPLTLQVDDSPLQSRTTSLQAQEVQNVTVRSEGAPMNSGNVTFTYTDLYGGAWTTRPILLPVAKAFVNTAAILTGTCTAPIGVAGAQSFCNLGDEASAGDQGNRDIYKGATAEFVTSSKYETRHLSIVKTTGIAAVDASDGQDRIVQPTTTSTTFQVYGPMATVANQWIPVGGDLTNDVYVATIPTTKSNGMYKFTLSNPLGADGGADQSINPANGIETGDGVMEAAALRKGDWIYVGSKKNTASEGHSCLVQVAADYVDGSLDLWIAADDTVSPCILTPGVATSQIFAQWKVLETSAGENYDGGSRYNSNRATKFDASTGTLHFDQPATVGTLYKQLQPGTWIRIFHNNKPGAPYCDMQTNHFTAALPAAGSTEASVTVDTSSITSTTAGGSYLCRSWSFLDEDKNTGVYLGGDSNVGIMLIQNYQGLISTASGDLHAAARFFPASEGTDTTTIGTAGTTNGVATNTLTFSKSPSAANRQFLRRGTLVYIIDDALAAGDTVVKCAGLISEDWTTGTSIKLAAPPVIAGVTLAGTQQGCETINAAGAAANYRVLIFPGNSLSFDTKSTDTYMFGHMQAGDSLRLSNPRGYGSPSDQTNMAATFRITHMDPAIPAGTVSSSVFFAVGSKPNGGGMHPMVSVVPSEAVDETTDLGGCMQGSKAHRQYLSSTFVAQPFRAAKAMAGSDTTTTWLTTDASALSSAKDVKRVLEELPNRVVDQVDVTMTSNTVGMYAYNVTFSGPRVSGNQNGIVMNAKGCNVDGCQPRFTGVNVQSAFALDDVYVQENQIKSIKDGTDLTTYVNAKGGETLVLYSAGTDAAVKGYNTGVAMPSRYTESYATKAVTRQMTIDTQTGTATDLVTLTVNALAGIVTELGTQAFGDNGAEGVVTARSTGSSLTIRVMDMGHANAGFVTSAKLSLVAAESNAIVTAAGDVTYADGGNKAVQLRTLGDVDYGKEIGFLVLKAKGDKNEHDDSAYFKSETHELVRGTTESLECSGRGQCASEDGVCACYDGYTGEACEVQTALL
jgi:hypothetical protein